VDLWTWISNKQVVSRGRKCFFESGKILIINNIFMIFMMVSVVTGRVECSRCTFQTWTSISPLIKNNFYCCLLSALFDMRSSSGEQTILSQNLCKSVYWTLPSRLRNEFGRSCSWHDELEGFIDNFSCRWFLWWN
jgi:hypothetical protein